MDYDTDGAATARALQSGVIDSVASDPAAAIAAADAVLIAVPTPGIAAVVEQIGDARRPSADHGIRRRQRQRQRARRIAAAGPACRHGSCRVIQWRVRNIMALPRPTPSLFRDCRVILTPQPETDRAAIERVAGWWRAAGASVVETSTPTPR